MARELSVSLVKADPGIRPGIPFGDPQGIVGVRGEEAGLAGLEVHPLIVAEELSESLVAGHEVTPGRILAADLKGGGRFDGTTMLDQVVVENGAAADVLEP